MKTTPTGPPTRRAVVAFYAEQQRRLVANLKAAARLAAFNNYTRRNPTKKGN